ncbi:MAG: hypothetical protein KGH93_02260 [Patescibacteria group bacterium]|nr:hypothetical protein [Patescibacteria group bacterium]MDE1946001.1 hypothetical protein [Patescibacteria group bacterium]
MQNIFFHSVSTGLLPVVGRMLVVALPIFIPVILVIVWWILRFRWLTLRFVSEQKPCLLEIKLPKEIVKSPAGMEIFFSYLAQSGAGNWGEAFIDGKTRPWFSCELVSTGGTVHFYVWMSQAKFKTIIEAQLYAQYPSIEIHEVEPKDDYVNGIHFDMDKYALSGVQYTFTKKDPYPIKSYIDYELNEDSKEEYKIDPLSSVLEFLGSLKPGENVWTQIMIRRHDSESWKHGVIHLEADEKKDGFVKKQWHNLFGKARKYKDEIKEEIEKVRQEAIPKSDDKETFKFPNPTKGQNEIIAALERHAAKTAFDCMIRSVYVAEKAASVPVNIGGMIGSMRQYGSNYLNGFKPGFTTDVSDTRKDMARIFPFVKKENEKRIFNFKKNIFHAYKLRSFFEWPYKYWKSKPFIMTTEELATIFHFPSNVVSQTPTLKRVGSKKSEAPANLPV